MTLNLIINIGSFAILTLSVIQTRKVVDAPRFPFLAFIPQSLVI
jgi:hypothetical protein